MNMCYLILIQIYFIEHFQPHKQTLRHRLKLIPAQVDFADKLLARKQHGIKTTQLVATQINYTNRAHVQEQTWLN